MEITWRFSALTSGLHALAALVCQETFVDRALADTLAEPATQAKASLAAEGLDPARVFELLVPLSAHIEASQELARAVLSKLLGADHAARATPALTRVIDRARAILRSASP